MVRVGEPCSFYHEGGSGERKWVIGWRAGFVDAIKADRIRIELRIPRWEHDPRKRKWSRKPFEKVWVAAAVVNELGDCLYHGPTAVEVYQERQEEKAAQQAKAEKLKAKGRRFSR